MADRSRREVRTGGVVDDREDEGVVQLDWGRGAHASASQSPPLHTRRLTGLLAFGAVASKRPLHDVVPLVAVDPSSEEIREAGPVQRALLWGQELCQAQFERDEVGSATRR